MELKQRRASWTEILTNVEEIFDLLATKNLIKKRSVFDETPNYYFYHIRCNILSYFDYDLIWLENIFIFLNLFLQGMQSYL